MKNHIQDYTDDELFMIDFLVNSPKSRDNKELCQILKDAKNDMQAFCEKVNDIRDFYESV
jgi:hypothetical protein